MELTKLLKTGLDEAKSIVNKANTPVTMSVPKAIFNSFEVLRILLLKIKNGSENSLGIANAKMTTECINPNTGDLILSACNKPQRRISDMIFMLMASAVLNIIADNEVNSHPPNAM